MTPAELKRLRELAELQRRRELGEAARLERRIWPNGERG